MGYKNKTTKEYQAEWREKNREKCRKNSLKWAKAHRESCREKVKKYKERHPDKVKEWGIKSKQKLKTKALILYGGTPPKCACCGEKEIDFLTMDHINGGGNKHRKTESNPTNIYQWLKSNEYPQGFRVLCMNCNWAIGVHGLCPHQKR